MKKFKGKEICIIFSVIFSTLILLQISYAADIQVTKSSASQIKIGDILEVTISINNLGSSAIDVAVKESIAGADPVDPSAFNIVKCPPDIKLCAELPYYSWNVTLNPSSIYTITYKIKPLTLGTFKIPATKVTNVLGEVFYSDSLQISVLCNSNSICESNLGENYFNCPQDCPSGSADGVCDLIKDGKCDPDCTPGTDSDCVTTTTITTTTTSGGKSSGSIYIYIIIFVVIIAVIAIFFLRRIKIVRQDQ